MRRKCTGAKHSTEIADAVSLRRDCVVEERFHLLRRSTVKSAGAMGGENVRMSNRKRRESRLRRKPEVSSAMSIIGG